MFLFIIITTLLSVTTCNSVTASDNGTFYYFAYGSNLLAKRIHIHNPTAVFYSSAKLENYRLDFSKYFEPWHGSVATIVENEDEVVWGVIWTLDISQMKYLDEQEQVNTHLYFAKNVTVKTPDGSEILARTYQVTSDGTKLSIGQGLPLETRPSSTYLEVIAFGAVESLLPAEYIAFIFSFPTNGRMATKEIRDE